MPNGVSVAQVDVTPRIRAFLSIGNTEFTRKDGLPLSVDSAVWYIEAGLNFDLATAWVACTDQVLDSLELSVPKTAGGVDEGDAFTAFQTLYASISGELVPEQSHLVVADVASLDAGNSVTLKVYYIIGSGYDKTNNLITSYGPNEHIHFGFGNLPNNSCGCSTNQAPTQCADLRIAQRVNAALPGLTYPCYYTNVVLVGIMWPNGGPNFIGNFPASDFPTGIPATPHKIYHCQGAGCSNCLSPSKMSFYTQGAWDIMNQVRPSGKATISCTMDDTSILSGPVTSTYFHRILFSFGTLNCPRN